MDISMSPLEEFVHAVDDAAAQFRASTVDTRTTAQPNLTEGSARLGMYDPTDPDWGSDGETDVDDDLGEFDRGNTTGPGDDPTQTSAAARATRRKEVPRESEGCSLVGPLFPSSKRMSR
ncbi:hypothetical protein F5Y06DRAFT_298045 [Hypoxylon sp. FL0890]|nr:hypothetical protein F5Y06DRAFT_298045 [Hypoxylon sp. FL0890]